MKLDVYRKLNVGAVCFSAALEEDETLSNSYAREIFKKFKFKPPQKENADGKFEHAQNAYLNFCNVILFEFFKNLLGPNFLFSALSFRKKQEKKPIIVKGNDRKTNYNIYKEVISNWQQVRNQLRKSIDEMYQEKIVSLTNILIDTDEPYDLFFINSEKEYGEEIINELAKIKIYKLNDIQYVKNTDKFLSINEQKIDEFISHSKSSSSKDKYAGYIKNYKYLADKYRAKNPGNDFLLHFITSSAFRTEYKVLLSLATNRLLNEDELVLIDLLIHKIVSETAVEKAREIERSKNEAVQHATRTAISQVLARNMSHNIGSHVSYKATNPAIKKRLIDLYPNQLKLKTLNENKDVIDWIDFMSEKLDKYEIHRNEYLADYSLSPQSFRFYEDVILPFCENTLILDNIASMEGADYPKPDENITIKHSPKNRLVIRVFIKKNGDASFREIKANYPDLTCIFSGDCCNEEIIYPDNFLYLIKNKDEKNSLSDGIKNKVIQDSGLDVEVLLHSEQGFYSVLENFIRNSAKHNKSKIKEIGILEIRLHLNEVKAKGDRYELTISDNVSELHSEGLFDESSQNQGMFQRMKTQIVTDGDQSGKQNLGFADMTINSFLFRYNASNITNKNLNKYLHLVAIKNDVTNLEAERILTNPKHNKKVNSFINPTNKKYKFGYQLRLLKPKKVLWVGEDITINDKKEKISSLKKQGIFQFINVNEYLQDENNNEIAAFDFVVFYQNFDFEDYLKNQIYLPARVIVINFDGKERYDKPNIKYVDNYETVTGANELVETCWAEWLNRLKSPVNAYIYYEKNEEAGEKLKDIELMGNHFIKCANELPEETVINNNIISVIYDHHGRALDEKVTNLSLKEGEKFDSVINFYTTHTKIFFDKGSDDFVILNYLPNDPLKKRILAYQLIDAATTNIFVLDERIATAANEVVNNSLRDSSLGIKSDYDDFNFSRLCYGKVFAINNIKIKNKEDVLIHSDNGHYYLSMEIRKEKIKLNSAENVQEVLGDIDDIRKDILVIHRTYLKKEMLGMEVEDFLKLANRQFGSVVITSGGGYPHTLPQKVKFVPFSIIEKSIASRISKLKLTSYLQKLRYVS